jgi:pimeloyl-ACP methyl ester carboxylesterase
LIYDDTTEEVANMRTQFLTRPDGAIAYDDTGGTGPLVVCAPGLGDLRGEYRLLAPRVAAAGYRVVTMDLRGHGESSVGWRDYSQAAIGSDFVALIRHLDAGPARVIGTSYAAGAAVCAAAEAPELVAGIALISPFVREHGTAGQQRRARLLYSLLFARPWGVAVWKGYFPRFFPTRKPDDFADYVRGLAANLREPGRLRAARAMITSASADSEAALGQVRAPALVVLGARDSDFSDPRQEAEEIVRRLGGTTARAALIAGAGHYPHVELPEETAPVLAEFLAQTRERVAQGD